jgi:hypothetical protein
MYALARNAGKYSSRDGRTDKTLLIEYDFLAPDSINEMMEAMQLFKSLTAKAWALKNKKTIADKELLKKGEALLTSKNDDVNGLEINAEGFENSNRKTLLAKVPEAYMVFKKMIIYYGISQLLEFIEEKKITSWQKLLKALPANAERIDWVNAGGQLVPAPAMQTLIKNIRSGKVNSWDEIHAFYNRKSKDYMADKFRHSFAALLEVLNLTTKKFTKKLFLQLIEEAITTKEWICSGIYASRAKDYTNPFRTMLYETEQEMEMVIGKLKDNSFILAQQKELNSFIQKAEQVIVLMK